jgi:hypothetical protein
MNAHSRSVQFNKLVAYSLIAFAPALVAAAGCASARAGQGMNRRLAVLHLTTGEPYSRARQTLLRAGWRPAPGRGYRGLIDSFLRVGWVEVSNCSGTGLGFCSFDWKRGRQCARVITYGENPPERGGPYIHDATIGGCRKIFAQLTVSPAKAGIHAA